MDMKSDNVSIILTSSFNTIAQELRAKGHLPEKASVAFIANAADPYQEKPWMEADRKAIINLGYTITDIDLRETTRDALKAALASFNIIFVGGGNTTYLTELSHRSGFHEIIRDLLNQGKIYVGSSAGSILAGPSVEPFVKGDLPELSSDFTLTNSTCLGLVDYIILPHYSAHKAETKDQMADAYGSRFQFVKITDQEYRCENVSV